MCVKLIPLIRLLFNCMKINLYSSLSFYAGTTLCIENDSKNMYVPYRLEVSRVYNYLTMAFKRKLVIFGY